MDTTIEILMPYTISSKPVTLQVPCLFERKEDLVSFALDYNIDLNIEGAQLVSKTEKEFQCLYVFRFGTMNEAIEFITTKRITHAYQSREQRSVKNIEKEMNAMMRKFEEGERAMSKSKRQKKLVKTEDGFMKYV